jgi:hypothetical protein
MVFFPGKKWATNFFKRNQQISMRKVSKKKKGATFVTEHAVEKWLLDLFEYVQKRGHEDIWSHPGRIFNLDETGFVLDGNSGRLQKFITRKGARYVAKEQVGTQQQVTVALLVSNAGDMYNPFVIVPSASAPGPAKDILVHKDLYPEAKYWQTKDGWMTSEAFVAAVKAFYEEAKKNRVKFPVVLIVDGYAAHISLEVAMFCNENDIILYCLLPHATNILQPLDVTVMGPLKDHYRDVVHAYQKERGPFAFLDKHNFPGVLKKALQKIEPKTIANGFTKTGIYPLDFHPTTMRKLPAPPEEIQARLDNALNAANKPKQKFKTVIMYTDGEVVEIAHHKNAKKSLLFGSTQKKVLTKPIFLKSAKKTKFLNFSPYFPFFFPFFSVFPVFPFFRKKKKKFRSRSVSV